jgi:hypothetical protein
MEKIPVKVVWVKDINSKIHSSVMVAMDELVGSAGRVDYSSVKKFNEDYQKLISKCKKVMTSHKVKSRIQPSGYWKVGDILNEFVGQNESNFRFTNYRVAFQRDLDVTDSYIGIIMDFPKFFKENEVINGLAMSYYFELLLKARILLKTNKFDSEKEKLINLHKEGRLPDHKSYRKMLKELVSK